MKGHMQLIAGANQRTVPHDVVPFDKTLCLKARIEIDMCQLRCSVRPWRNLD